MSKKSKSTSTINQTTTPINPPEVTGALTGIAGKVNDLGSLDPYSLAPGTNQWLDRAGEMAMGIGQGAGSQFLNDYLGGSAAQGSSTDASGLIDKFQNPWLEQVVKASLAQFDENAGMERAQRDLALNKSGAFGGSGGAIASMLTDRASQMNRGSLDAGLRSQGYAQALQAALQQAGLDTQASLANADMSNRHSAQQAQAALGLNADERANSAFLGDIGNVFRAIEQQQAMAPYTQAQLQAGIMGMAPFGLMQGQNMTGTQTSTTKTSDPLGALGSLAMLAAAPFTGGASLAGLGGLGQIGALSAGLGAAKNISNGGW